LTKKKQASRHPYLKLIGIGLVTFAVILSFFNISLTAIGLMETPGGDGDGGGPTSVSQVWQWLRDFAGMITIRSLLILGMLILGVLLILLG
jgi:hypothetical protein